MVGHRKGDQQRQICVTTETATSETQKRCWEIRMAETDMRDGGDGGGRNWQGRHRLIRTAELDTLDARECV